MKNKVKATKKELFYNDFSDKWESKIDNAETSKRLRIIFKEFLTGKDLKGKKFLEVGCGLGYFSEKALKHGALVTATDVGENLVKKTKERVRKGIFKVASASNLPFKDKSFDVVLSTEVIEHVENQESAIKEMCRVLKKGGILVLTTPNKLFKPLFDFFSLIGIRPYHGNEYWIAADNLKTEIEKHNMRLEKEYWFNFFQVRKSLAWLDNVKIISPLMINYGFRYTKK